MIPVRPPPAPPPPCGVVWLRVASLPRLWCGVVWCGCGLLRASWDAILVTVVAVGALMGKKCAQSHSFGLGRVGGGGYHWGGGGGRRTENRDHIFIIVLFIFVCMYVYIYIYIYIYIYTYVDLFVMQACTFTDHRWRASACIVTLVCRPQPWRFGEFASPYVQFPVSKSANF